jgi:Fe(3+) dicitrate transport protein
MNNLLKITLLGIGILNAQESTKPIDSIQNLEPVFINSQVIFGSKYEAKNRTGSSFYLSPEELLRYKQSPKISAWCEYL